MERIPCTPTEECRYAPDCYRDVHHAYWPKRRYKGGVERQFRELEVNKTDICRALHDEIHATEQPPKKPSRNEMLQVIGEHAIQIRRAS